MTARFPIFVAVLLALPWTASAASVRVHFEPPAFDSLQFRTESDQAYSLTRLDFILSELELQKNDGNWVGQNDWFAYLSLRNGLDVFTLKGVPEGGYKAMRFLVGVRPEINKADVTKYPPNHPLNPTLNTLWWGWQGGFVFMAIEGGWRSADHGVSGFSFHVARDPNLMRVTLETPLDVSQDMEVSLKLDPKLILKGVKLSDDGNSTHSRDEDALATQLHLNIEKAFSVSGIKAKPLLADAKAPKVVLNPQETLQPFTFAAHFPRPSLPGDNPLTKETIELGKQLFADKRLSVNNSQACSDCHDMAHAFSGPRRFSLGAEGHVGSRNAMPLFNLAWKRQFFWDGRSPSLRDQVLRPIQDPNEMRETLPNIEKKLGLSADRVSRALEQYLLTLISDKAKIDRVMSGTATFTEQEQRGFTLFHTEYDPAHGQRGADCFHCHGGALFQSLPFANNGLDAQPKDIGLEAVTKKPGDRAKFAVPSLRNVERTAPYMHDGRFATLAEVIDHYDHGVIHTETLDPNLAKHPPNGLGLSAEDKAALIAFLRTLTDQAFVGE